VRSAGQVGARTPLLEADAIVTGCARFTTDLYRPGMLHARLRYSDHPRARVLKVDTSRARAMPGVVAVVTAAEAPPEFNQRVGLSVRDRRLLVEGTVRCVNDVLAVVAAEDEATAQAAADAIEVEYEVLPPVLTFAEAIAPGAPLVHEDKPGYETADYIQPFFSPAPDNVATRLRLEVGDVEAARRASATVVAGTFATQRVEHFSMEPHAALAEWDEVGGRLTVWCSTGKPFRFLNQLAPLMGLPMSRVRIVTPHVGGDFGGKGQLALEPYVALLARLTGRPVKGVYTRMEEFVASSHKTAFEIELELGFAADGRLLFLRGDLRSDTGAYDTYASMVQIHGAAHLTGPYRVPNVLITGTVVYTNNVSSGSFRGFGSPQVSFARESLVDEAARQLGIDPIELRLRNAWRPGDVTATGQVLDPGRIGVSIADTLEAARGVVEELSASAPEAGRLRRGIGVASGHQGIGGGIWAGADVGTVIVKANFDGSMAVNVGVGDVGQGASTALAQIVAEELRLPLDQLVVNPERDTDLAPYDGGASASRQLFVTGSAAQAAGALMRARLLEIAGQILEVAPEDLVLEDGAVHVRGYPDRRLGLGEIVRHSLQRLGEQPIAVGRFASPVVRLDANLRGAPFQAFDYVTTVAEVEVDVETGVVRTTRLATIQDVGRAINPMIVEGQMEGGAVQGLGFALLEEVVLEDGYVVNPHAFDYRLPRFPDAPSLKNVILEHPNPRGPYGAKATGEAPLIPVAAAIANAIRDAVGVRMHRLPMSGEAVLERLSADRSRSLP